MGAAQQFQALHAQWSTRARTRTHSRMPRCARGHRSRCVTPLREGMQPCLRLRLRLPAMPHHLPALRPPASLVPPVLSLTTRTLSPLPSSLSRTPPAPAGSSDLSTRALLLSTYVKLGHIYPELQQTVAAVFQNCRSALDQEVQQVGSRGAGCVRGWRCRSLAAWLAVGLSGWQAVCQSACRSVSLSVSLSCSSVSQS
jgi:hypothetical protein